MGDHDYFEGLQAELDNGGYEALLHYLLHEVNLEGFNVRKVPQTEALRQQRDQSLPPLESWWVELLEIGSLWGAHPIEPHRAVSNRYQREVNCGKFGKYINQNGLYDQARQIEPRLRHYTNDHNLGRFLSQMGCDNTQKVMRKQGWAFPPLKECRARWEARYPGWKWRNPEITNWQPEDGDYVDYEIDAPSPTPFQENLPLGGGGKNDDGGI
jgi:hypothetical protein